MSRQAALMLALAAIALAGAVVSFGAWILLRRRDEDAETGASTAAVDRRDAD